MNQAGTIEVIKIRDIALQVSRDQVVSNDAVEDARLTIRAICKEASKFGLTTADVVRAVFRPALEDRTNACNCPTCRSRSTRLDLDELRPMGDVASPSPLA
ncbi:MAG: hypothetical protein BZY73_06460 [SAR202 cluster bacterium Casp-Chloro-G3]|nr:hypothetical protein [Chloroflexota bacterium]PKB56786.1 MAG: hypothetical protein BZY73_06460 [SAR202 cluster bacterium Casp-Chloro-G3]